MQIIFNNSHNLIDTIEYISNFKIIKDNRIENIEPSSKKFEHIKENLTTLFSNSRLMPALGVSINSLTLEELQKDTWLEIEFSKTLIKNDLLFDALLIKLEETGGITIIRKLNNQYSGRCLYLDLEKTTDLSSVVLTKFLLD